MHRHGGISRYFVELLKRLPNFGVTPRLVVPISFNEYLATTPQINRGFSSSRFHVRGAVRLTTLISRCSDHVIPKLVSHDLVHHTFYARKAISPTPAVCTIVNMIPEVLPSQFPFGNPHQGKFEMARRCSGIIAISDTTKADILRLMPRLKARVVAIPLAVDVAQFRRLSSQPPKSPVTTFCSSGIVIPTRTLAASLQPWHPFLRRMRGLDYFAPAVVRSLIVKCSHFGKLECSSGSSSAKSPTNSWHPCTEEPVASYFPRSTRALGCPYLKLLVSKRQSR